MQVKQLDHVVLAEADIDRTREFYQRAVGMKSVANNGRWSLHFGTEKLNLRAYYGYEFELKATHPTLGSAALCQRLINHFQRSSIETIEGLIQRTGAQGPILSICFFDPDLNLINVANQLSENDFK
ncbi:unnamed protein product [Rotaria socialis]|uniref:VOC domain-containing protein n=1 Tax=Rotaria socialis TaxID=392032 RepID=A0A821NGP1_9BILA|nr:unnamed protein product [Rotaria socialis]CAF4787122.1 unnamed protein product [Rotaria socialis]